MAGAVTSDPTSLQMLEIGLLDTEYIICLRGAMGQSIATFPEHGLKKH